MSRSTNVPHSEFTPAIISSIGVGATRLEKQEYEQLGSTPAKSDNRCIRVRIYILVRLCSTRPRMVSAGPEPDIQYTNAASVLC